MRKHTSLLAAAGTAVAIALSGCGGSHPPPTQPPAQLERVPGNPSGKIVLSDAGAQRIGLQTAQAHAAGGPSVAIPFSAVIYDPSGNTFAFVAVARLTYTEVPVVVGHIDGGTAYLLKGPPAGSQVVSTGAEELFGVQTGVLGQT